MFSRISKKTETGAREFPLGFSDGQWTNLGLNGKNKSCVFVFGSYIDTILGGYFEGRHSPKILRDQDQVRLW